jgi:DNA-binding transcriptional ArsR family regulator
MISPDHDPPARQQVFHVEAEHHFQAIGSPVRLEMLELFRSTGPLSVAELAAQMARPADGLYHHLKKLESCGMVREVATRQRGRQIERIYDAAADEYRVAEDSQHLVRIWRLISSHAERTLADSLDADAVRFRGPDRNTAMRIETARLTTEARAKVIEHLDAIRAIFTEARMHPGDEQASLTFALVPGNRQPQPAEAESSQVSQSSANRTRPQRNTEPSDPNKSAHAKRSPQPTGDRNRARRNPSS